MYLMARKDYRACNSFIKLFLCCTFTVASLFFFSSTNPASAASVDTLNFQGKIVIKSSGSNIGADNPACIVNESTDTCAFRVGYYAAVTGGDPLWVEEFDNVELGDQNGVFTLALGTGNKTDGSETSYTDIYLNNSSVYMAIEFDPTGEATFSSPESFTVDGTNRMQMRAVPYAMIASKLDNSNTQFIRNQTGVQSDASYNISGNGTIGGSLMLGIGTAASGVKLDINSNLGVLPAAPIDTSVRIGGADNSNSQLVIDTFGGYSTFMARRADGTAASPSGLLGNELIGSLGAWGYYNGDTPGYTTTARAAYAMFASEDWTDTAQGTFLSLFTTDNGATSQTERLRIDSNGNVGIGATSDLDNKLVVNGDIKLMGESNITFPFLFQTAEVSGSNGYSGLMLKPNGASSDYPASRLVIDTGDNTQTNKNSGLLLKVGGTDSASLNMGTNDLNLDNLTGSDIYFRFGSSATPMFHFQDDGNAYATNWATPYSDFAEYYQTKVTMQKGQLVAITADNKIDVATSDNKVIGIISTNPGFTSGIQNIEGSFDGYPVALSGRVPAMMLKVNSDIAAGDPVTTSPLQGVGMRLDRAGGTVGKALESTVNWNTNNCQSAASFMTITWPQDDGSNQGHPCFKLPVSSLPDDVKAQLQQAVKGDFNEIYVGKIMVFVNIGWYEPQTYIANIKDLLKDYNAGLLTNPVGQGVTNISGDLLQYNQAQFTNMQATSAIISAISSDQISTVNMGVTGLLTSSKIKTAFIEAFDQSDLVIRLTDNNGLSAFKLINSDNTVLFSVGSSGNVNILGKLTFATDNTDAASVGTATIKAGLQEVEIKTSAATTKTKIFLSVDDNSNFRFPVLKVSEKNDGSFVVKCDSILTEDLNFDWWIIN